MAKQRRDLGGLVAYLHDQEVRVTPIRKAVLKVLLANDEPMRVDDVHGLIDGVDLVTVYRTLELFVKIGLVRPVRFHEDSARYELSDAVREHHHHHVCTVCGRITDVQGCLPSSVTDRIEKETGLVITSHMLEYFGQCTTCRKQPPPSMSSRKPRTKRRTGRSSSKT